MFIKVLLSQFEKNGAGFLFPVPRGELLVFHTVVGVLEPVETSLIISACLFCCIHMRMFDVTFIVTTYE